MAAAALVLVLALLPVFLPPTPPLLLARLPICWGPPSDIDIIIDPLPPDAFPVIVDVRPATALLLLLQPLLP
jgi:hypothetical protein